LAKLFPELEHIPVPADCWAIAGADSCTSRLLSNSWIHELSYFT
jgi:hypothetical protein